MKKLISLIIISICILTSVLTDTMAVYTKTLPAIYGTITAQTSILSNYPLWDAQKELNHEYKINDIVQYKGTLYQRINSGASQNDMTPDKNKSWVIIEYNKYKME